MLLKLRYLIEYALVRIVIATLSPLPFSWTAWLAKRFGNITYFFFGERKKIALENITRAFKDRLSEKEKEALLYRSFENMMLSVIEFFLIEKILKDPLRHFKLYGAKNLDDAHDKIKGTILAIAHLGSWECLECLSTLTRHESYVVVKSFRNPYLDRWISTLRQSTRTAPVRKNEDSALRKIIRAMKEQHPVAILIDQWAGPDGVWVDFFGEPTSTTSLPAKIAHKTGAAVLTSYCVRRAPWQFEIHIEEPIPLNGTGPEAEIATTRLLNKRLEELILKYPDQWTWVHRRWKPRPKGI